MGIADKTLDELYAGASWLPDELSPLWIAARRMLLTAATFAGAGLCVLACLARLATKKGQALPFERLTLTLLAAVMIIGFIWPFSPPEGWRWGWLLLYITVSVSVFSVAGAHVALLSMARLAKRYRWLLSAAYTTIFGVASLILLIVLFIMLMSIVVGEVLEFTSESLLAPLPLLLFTIHGSITVVIVILHWLSKAEVAAKSQNLPNARHGGNQAEIEKLKEHIAQLERRKHLTESEFLTWQELRERVAELECRKQQGL